MQETWTEILICWENIDEVMIELQIPKFGLPKDFQDLEKKMANFRTSDLKYEKNKKLPPWSEVK